MINRKEIKKEAQKVIKKNPWTLILLGLFMTVIVGKYVFNNDNLKNLDIIAQLWDDIQSGKTITFWDKDNADVIINKYVDQSISQFVFGNNMTKVIQEYNASHNVTKGVIFSIFNFITNGQTQLQNLVTSIAEYENKEAVMSIVIIAMATIGMLIRVFITNPIQIGETRIYLESMNYKKTQITRIVYPFRKGRYMSSVRAMLLVGIYQNLWNLTIIGGIIKKYSYKMVPYIIAENPGIKASDAIKMSRDMMNGHKFETFELDVSFIGWYILEYITLGLAGIYVTPYYTATYTQLYKELRKEYINNKEYNYKLLNDEKLYDENTELDTYPDKNEIEKNKIKIDYNKNYEISSIILFFFIFSFIGWLWEVGLYLFRDGMFVNRGTMYGPWLPIYGTGCTVIILLTKFKSFRKTLKNPFLTFNIVMLICSVIEYFTSWYIEATSGLRYWDYTGIFMNLNGRICLECSLFFGIGGCFCVYIVAPFLERKFQKIDKKKKLTICTILIVLFASDSVISQIYPHEGEGISSNTGNSKPEINFIFKKER